MRSHFLLLALGRGAQSFPTASSSPVTQTARWGATARPHTFPSKSVMFWFWFLHSSSPRFSMSFSPAPSLLPSHAAQSAGEQDCSQLEPQECHAHVKHSFALLCKGGILCRGEPRAVLLSLANTLNCPVFQTLCFLFI